MEFKNKNIENYIKVILNKQPKKITQKDLYNIYTLNISNLNYTTKKREYDFTEINKFLFLNKIVIENSIISLEDIEVFKKNGVSNIKFINCFFYDISELKELYLRKLSIIDCMNVNDFSWLASMNKLVMLEIKNKDKKVLINANDLLNMHNLSSLILKNIILENIINFRNVVTNINLLILEKVDLERLEFLNCIKADSTIILDKINKDNYYVVNNKNRIKIYFDYAVFTSGT